uniref:Putative secreted protein n=1 Tax=Amblyomma triste TaxID=251400 RepID=A0A023G1P7_AMBTT
MLLLLAFLQVVASAQGQDPCSWEAIKTCYRELAPKVRDELHPDEQGNINDEELERECRELPSRSDCYNELSLCSDDVKTNASFLEEGYKQLRDFTCDKDALKGLYKLVPCVDVHIMKECRRKYLPDALKEQVDECREASLYTTCTEETARQSCPKEYDEFRASFKRLSAAVQMLLGCERSSQATLVPHTIIVGLAAVILLLRVKET